MLPFEVRVQVEEEVLAPISHAWLKSVAQETLRAGGASSGTSITIVIADDKLVHELNRQHRGLDETTDVLSFSFNHEGQYYGADQPPSQIHNVSFVLPPDVPETLGDVIISYPQAQRQAFQAGQSVEQEMAALLAHGILHLLGHDHNTCLEENKMNKVAAQILAVLKTSDTIPSET